MIDDSYLLLGMNLNCLFLIKIVSNSNADSEIRICLFSVTNLFLSRMYSGIILDFFNLLKCSLFSVVVVCWFVFNRLLRVH